MALYNERGNIRVTVDDTSVPFGIYAADGSLRVTVVDGTTRTGIYAPDGSYNVFVTTATDAPHGLYHPCGALYGTDTSPGDNGVLAPSGALFMDGLDVAAPAAVLTADSGHYTIMGSDATLQLTYILSSSVGSYSVTGADATLSSTTIGPPAVGNWDREVEDGWRRILENGDIRVTEDSTNDVLTGLTVTPLAGGTTASFTVASSATTGVFYAGVYPATATEPSAAQIEAGTDGDDDPFLWDITFNLSSIDDGFAGPSGLIQEEDYKLSATVRLSSTPGDYANVATDAFTTLDAAPILTAVDVATTGSSGGASTALFSVVTDDPSGSIKWGYFPAASTPTKSNILNGTGGALAFGSKSVSSTGLKHVIGTAGMAPSTAYRLHAYQIDGNTAEGDIITSSSFDTYPNETSQFQVFHNGSATSSNHAVNANLSITDSQTDVLGGSNAVKFTLTSSGVLTGSSIYQANSFAFNHGNNRFRVFLKKGTWTTAGAHIRWRVTNVGADLSSIFQFDLNNGVFSGVGNGISLYEAVKLEDGWWYLQWNANLTDSTAPVDSTGLAAFNHSETANGNSVTTAGTYELLIYDYRSTY